MRTTAGICLALAMACGACADVAMPVTAPRPVSPLVAALSGAVPGVTARPAAAFVRLGQPPVRLCRLGRIDPAPEEFVIDGRIVHKEGLARMNLHPADIVSIEIAKGPSAVERYGPDAAHGIVIVTTRGPTAR